MDSNNRLGQRQILAALPSSYSQYESIRVTWIINI